MKSQHSVALDSNMLVLFIVGLYNRNAISEHRRLGSYSSDDYDKLIMLVESFDRLATTPQSLAEVSNLLEFDKKTSPHTLGLLKALLQGAPGFDNLCEDSLPSKDVVQEESFMWLGLADASFVELAKGGTPVITADAKLFARLVSVNPHCVNFTAYAFGC